jgi:hypothetical protein
VVWMWMCVWMCVSLCVVWGASALSSRCPRIPRLSFHRGALELLRCNVEGQPIYCVGARACRGYRSRAVLWRRLRK